MHAPGLAGFLCVSGCTHALLRLWAPCRPAVPPSGRWLKTEYQTLRRLPRTRAILFTVRTMVEPLPTLEAHPTAAAALAASLRGMSPAMRAYKGMASAGAAEEVLCYLEGLSAAAGARAAA
jgi:hypothetical protein